MKKRILIVGGVAGGASCAARARRLDEDAEIIIFERGSHVSFANCGLPYFIGGVIPNRESLTVTDSAAFKDRFNIEVRLQSEVTAIDRARNEIEVNSLLAGELYRVRYDALVLSPGAVPLRPALPGVDLPGIFTLRTIPDSQRIVDWLENKQVRSAVIAGGGFIGLEMAENLAKRGLHVTIVEMMNQVLPPVDPEIAAPIEQRLRDRGIQLVLGDGVTGFKKTAGTRTQVMLKSGAACEADLIILAIGVRPESSLARSAGLELGERGGIRVNEQMQTSDPNIWAVGDAVEVRDFVTGQWTSVPLAGPANRQGRVAADAVCGRPSTFRGIQGTAICGAFGLTAALTGATEKSLKRAGITDYEVVHLHPRQHAAYYPDSKQMQFKLLFRRQDGRILGAQAVGEEGVDKRIDVISMALQKHGTIYDLEEAELCYAPQFGAAKDPVNLAGMVAANVLRGDVVTVPWASLGHNGYMLLDVRQPDEFQAGHVPGATNIPLPELRKRLGELSREKEIRLYCGVGQRAYYATRVLMQRGFRVKNFSGGFKTYQSCRAARLVS
ncbi:MAG TPA: FAD-dependent oxidoreductase [Candidatus Dormibacteraeota bacterium]|nr:FAD-dependent oxidoreductase [Candidatus Dormibacteraeota bacterium]